MSARNRHEDTYFYEKRDTVKDRFNGISERHYGARGDNESYPTDRDDDRQIQSTYTSESPQNTQRHLQVKPARARADQQRTLRHQRSSSSDSNQSNSEDDQDDDDSDSNCDEDEYPSSTKANLAVAGALVAGLASGYGGRKLQEYYKSHKAKKAGDKRMMRQSTRDLSPPRRPRAQNNSSHPSQYQSREFSAKTPLRSNDGHVRPTFAATRPLTLLARPPLSRADTEPSQRHIVQVRGASGDVVRSVTGPTRHQSSASDIGHPASTDRVKISRDMRNLRVDADINEETRLQVSLGLEDKPNRLRCCAYLDSGALTDAISKNLYDELSQWGHATRVDRSIVIPMEGADCRPLDVLGQTKVYVQWLRPGRLILPSAESSGQRQPEEWITKRFKFQVIRNLYPHVVFETRTTVENEMRESADTWPREDTKPFLMFNLPRKSREERQQDCTEHERKRAANMQRTQQEAEERARLRGDSEQLRNPRDRAKGSKSSKSRHSPR